MSRVRIIGNYAHQSRDDSTDDQNHGDQIGNEGELAFFERFNGYPA